ncbi:MAG: hypothetical protein ACI9EF_003789, partial [Pseudohongiellaceae bacterium]
SLAAVGQSQTLTKNTQEVGFVDLSSSGSRTEGLWAYEALGKRYCLQTQSTAGLRILDTTDPENPFLVRTVAGNFRKVQAYKNYAYATTDSGPTAIIDLTDPAAAVVVNLFGIGAHTLRIDESNDRLYLNRSSSLYIYDILADPTAPALLGIWSGGAHDCRPDGDLVYVNGFVSTPTRILDVSDPFVPTQIGTVADGNHASALYFAPTGEKVLLTCDEQSGGHVNLWDVTDASNTQFLSSYQTDDQSTSVHNVEVKGAYAYISYYQDQLRILDLRDLSNPVEVGVWDNNRLNTGSTFSDCWEALPNHDAVYMNQMNNTASGPKGTYTIDFFPAFGAGSDGAGAVEPEIWWSFGPPSPGNDDFAMRLTDAAPNAPAFLIIGASNTSWGPTPLPLNMTSVGAPNAVLNVSVDLLIPVTTDASGNASVALPLPLGLQYGTYYCQWAVKDVGAPNPGGWAFTKGGELVLK